MGWLTFKETTVDAARVVGIEEEVQTASDFARRKLGFEPDETQARVLDSTARRGMLCCSRQWGKSTVTAIKALHTAWTGSGRLVVVASPGERQSGEFLRKVKEFARRLGVRARGDGDNAISLLLPNGSRIVGLPGVEATSRGFSSVSLLLVDEAARVDDVLYKALRPMLAVGAGALWMMSTPRGRSGFFYEEWMHGGERWERFSVKGSECPRIPKEFLEEERVTQGAAWFSQEYQCEFVDNGAGWFERGVVEAALCDLEVIRIE